MKYSLLQWIAPVLVGATILSTYGAASTQSMIPSKSGSNQTGVVTPIKKRILSGEIRLNLPKTQSGKTIPTVSSWTGILIKPKAKSALEVAAERQKEREKALEQQKSEEQEQADRQRAIKAAYDAMKKAEDAARQAELEKRQTNETIEAYCDRASRQGFLERKWKVKSVNDCVAKLKNLEKVGRKIVENRLKDAMNQKRLGDRLKKLCVEEYIQTGKVGEYCAAVLSPRTGSGTTQTGGILTTR